MRMLARMCSTFTLVALAAPSVVSAQSMEPAPAPAQNVTVVHDHSLLFGKRHCVECQRAKALKKHGVNVPPPPALPGAVMTPGHSCAECGKPVMVMRDLGNGGALPALPAGYASTAGPAAGYAMASDMPPGWEPMAIGSYAPHLAAAGAASAGRGTQDPTVMPTSMASDPVSPHAHNRPHIIKHLLGLDGFEHERAIKDDKAKEKHASISYGPTNQVVSDLPAKMVYGK